MSVSGRGARSSSTKALIGRADVARVRATRLAAISAARAVGDHRHLLVRLNAQADATALRAPGGSSGRRHRSRLCCMIVHLPPCGLIQSQPPFPQSCSPPPSSDRRSRAKTRNWRSAPVPVLQNACGRSRSPRGCRVRPPRRRRTRGISTHQLAQRALRSACRSRSACRRARSAAARHLFSMISARRYMPEALVALHAACTAWRSIAWISAAMAMRLVERASGCRRCGTRASGRTDAAGCPTRSSWRCRCSWSGSAG